MTMKTGAWSDPSCLGAMPHLATDAAVTVLRVDQIIMSKPAGGPKAPEQGGMDDD